MNWNVLVDEPCQCGENPYVHPLDGKVYWTDIPRGQLFRCDPASKTCEKIYDDRPVGGFTIEPDGALILFRDRGNVVRFDPNTLEITATLIEQIDDELTTRFNDVMADFEGRVYAGTMPTKERPGRLYRIQRDLSYTILLEGIGCANGMGFTTDGKQMDFTDSGAREIYRFDYDRATGDLTHQQVFASTQPPGVPDGMVVDSAGDVWSAQWDGHGIEHYTASGEHVGKLDFPAGQITSLTYGGADMKDVYVTSAGGNERDKHGPHAGCLFHYRAEVAGQPEHPSKFTVS